MPKKLELILGALGIVGSFVLAITGEPSMLKNTCIAATLLSSSALTSKVYWEDK